MLSPLCPEALACRSQPPDGWDWSISEWFVNEWPSILRDAQAAGWAAYEFEQTVGEMVWVPPGWWHTVLNLESTVAINHTVLHNTRLRQAAHAGGCGNQAAAVINAFKLVDEDGIGDWLADVTRAHPNILDVTADQALNPWGLWGGVPLAPIGFHPWLLAPNPGLQLSVTQLLENCGVCVRAVFGRMYHWHPQLSRVSQSDAICIPAAQLDAALQACSGGLAVQKSDTIILKPMPQDCTSAQLCTHLLACCGGEELTVYVLDGCAIRDAATSVQCQPLGQATEQQQQPRGQDQPICSGFEDCSLDDKPVPVDGVPAPVDGIQTLATLVRHVLQVLNRHHVQASLIYGSLLGKVREGGIMTHDHDCDLMLASSSAAKVLALAAELERGGYMFVVCVDMLNHQDDADCELTLGELQERSCEVDVNTINQFKVYDKAAWESGRQGWCFCDLFLYDKVGPHIRIREDHCYLIPFPASLVLPLKPTRFMEEECWEPADPEGWLQFQYGEDWHVKSATMGWLSTRALHHDAWLWFDHA